MNKIKPIKQLCMLLILTFSIARLGLTRTAKAIEEITPGDHPGTIVVGKLSRTYVLHVPPIYDGSQAVPLVFVLHGGFGDAQRSMEITNFTFLSDKEGFLVVYPEGFKRHWNDGRKPSPSDADDIAFFTKLIEGLSARLNVDQDRIFCCGISNGGIMSHRAALDLSSKFAAVASVAGSVAAPISASLGPQYPISVMEIHGTADKLVPWAGGKVGVGGYVIPIDETIRRWTIWDNTSSIPTFTKLPDLDPNDGTTVEKYQYKSAQNPSEVVLLKVIGGGHTWPGSTVPSAVGAGITSKDIDATAEIWSFFLAHPKCKTSERKTLKFGGLTREYFVHVPLAYDGNTQAPLVFLLHGGGGNSRGTLIESDMMAKSDRSGFILVTPEATRPYPDKPASFTSNPQTWNDGSGRFLSGIQKVDDVGFIGNLITELQKTYKIDQFRVFCTGFSNGAAMTLRVGEQLSEKFSAIAPIAGHFWLDEQSLKKPVPLLYIIGTEDPLNPIEGGDIKLPSGKVEHHPPVQETIDKWVKMLSCPSDPKTISDKNGVKVVAYEGCNKGSEINYCTVEGLGHVWPGAKVSLLPESMVGKPSNKLIANDMVWDFFTKHSTK